MKTIIFLINILLPKQGLQHLGKNRVFYQKNWLYLCSWAKKTRFLREVFVTLGLAGPNGVFYPKLRCIGDPGLKKPFLRQVCITSGGVILPVNRVIADRLCGQQKTPTP
jgi:hypothetical protein